MAQLTADGLIPEEGEQLVDDPSANISPLPDTLPDPSEVPIDPVEAPIPIVGDMAQAGTPALPNIPAAVAGAIPAVAPPVVPENIPNAPMAVGEVGSGPMKGSGIMDDVISYVGDFFGKRWVKSDDKKIVDEIKKAETPAKAEAPEAMKDAGPTTVSTAQKLREKAFLDEVKNRQNLKINTGDISRFKPSFSGLNQQRSAIDDLGEVDKKYYDNLANIMSTPSGEALAKVDGQLVKDITLKKTFLDDSIKEFKKAFDDADKEEFKYDFWGSRSTGQKISAAIGVMLGGVSEGLTGKKNPVIGVIDKIMDRDLSQAKYKYQAGQTAKNRKLVYMQNIGKSLDAKTAADMATKAIYLGHIAREADKTANRMNSQKARANAKLLKGQLLQKKNEYMFKAQAGAMKAANEALKAQATKGIVNADLLTRFPEMAGKVPAHLLPKGMRKLKVPGVGIASTPEDKKAITNLASEKATLIKNLKDVIKMRAKQETNWNILSPSYRSDKAQAISKMNQIQLILKNPAWFQLGVLAGPDMGILNAVTGEPEDIFTAKLDPDDGGPDPITGKLQQVIDTIEHKWVSAMKSRMEIYDPSLTITPEETQNKFDEGSKARGK